MLDVPAYGLIAAQRRVLDRLCQKGRPVAIYLAALFLLAAIYTKYNAGFVAPALAAAFVVAKRRAALRDRHAVVAAGLAAVGLLPAIAMLCGSVPATSHPCPACSGTLPLDSLACWLFYLRSLPGQLGWLTVLLGAGGFVLTC